MAGKQLRSRSLPPLVGSVLEASQDFALLFGPAVGGGPLATIRGEIGEATTRSASIVDIKQMWGLQRCTLRTGELLMSSCFSADKQQAELQEMTGSHVQAQQQPLPVTLSNSSTDCGTSEEAENDGNQVLSDQESDENSIENDQLKRKKRVTKGADDKAGRLVVDNDLVASLVAEYRKHFSEFSKGRKKKPKQLIPNKVWSKVYSSYKKQFPSSKFKPDSLKIHLREAITELQSGVNNPEAENNQTGPELQDPDEMRELYRTEGFLRRNVLQVRQRSMDGITEKKRKEVSDSSTPAAAQAAQVPPVASQVTSREPPTPPSGKGQSNTKQLPRRFTKKEALQQAGEDIASMLSEVKSMKEKQSGSEDFKSKASLAEAKLHEMAIRSEEAAARRDEAAARKRESVARCEDLRLKQVFQAKQNLLAEISLLEKQRDLGLITDPEFKQKCRALFGN